MTKAILRDRLWIPRHAVRPEHFAPFQYQVVDPYTKEPYTVDTVAETLDAYGFPRGNLPKILALFSDFEIDDQRTSVPHGYKLRFTGELRGEQPMLVREWLAAGYGQIVSPPRSGKTVILTALMAKLRQRTFMLSHLEDLCHQFIETVRRFTNIEELEEQHGQKLAGVLDEWDDFFPIVTASTYQCFAVSRTGREILDQRRDDFGLVIVDEAHRAKTELYQVVTSKLSAAYRCGVTATPDRKDRLHCIVNDVIGPVVARGVGEQLPVDWTWEHTGHEVKGFSNWGVMLNRLVKNQARNRKIARKVVEDVKAGHFVLVTTERLKHIEDLAAEIHAIDPDVTIGHLSGKTKDRENFRKAARIGEYQVVIAMNKIVELGYNIPRWSSFHNTLPMTDPNNWYQRVSRIRTPFEPAFPGDRWDKPTPVARVWADRGHPAIYAYRMIVKKKMESLGFRCVNEEPVKPRGKRKGLVSFEEEPAL